MKNSQILKKIINFDLKKLFYQNNIGSLINKKVYKLPKIPKPIDTALQAGKAIFEAECPDLTRLYSIIKMRKIMTVLELGSGQSTKVIAEALKENKKNYSKEIALIRRNKPFHLYSIESEKKYATELIRSCKKNGLSNYVTVKFIEAEQTYFNGMICGKYKKIPPVCPDLIYIDGPMPMSYKNAQKQYLDMNNQDITNITCDLLIIEPVLLPGTIVIFDGGTNNARFNIRNLQRKWLSHQCIKNDYTILILDEQPLGVHHKNQLFFQNK